MTETGAERAVVTTPAGRSAPAGTAAVTRTTMFSGDPAYRGVQMVWFLLGLTELVVGLRVLFLALAATDTGFVSFIYGLGGALVAPFRGIATWTSGTTVIEVGSIVAMVVYLLAAYLVIKLVQIVAAPRVPDELGEGIRLFVLQEHPQSAPGARDRVWTRPGALLDLLFDVQQCIQRRSPAPAAVSITDFETA